jgi:spore coat polysaccharide biosynthesis protein SpsF
MQRLIVVQARTGSSRLPGKVLLPLAGRTVLEQQLERIRAAPARFDLVVATTTLVDDDAIVATCRRAGVDCFRGHPTDLLDRHVRAARARRADVVVKIPSDCPLIDPDAIARVLAASDRSEIPHDYVSNLHPATWPDGNDVEVMTHGALERAWREADKPYQREHATPFLWTQPGRFRVNNVIWETGRDCSRTHRFTLDHFEDYRFIAAVYAELGPGLFPLSAILALLEARPELRRINARYLGESWMDQQRHELEPVMR